MNTAPITSPSPVSATLSLDLSGARRLRDGLATLLRAERTAAAEFLLALSDFDRRRGWEPLGHASLFAFLRAELGLSSGAAFWRMSAARLLQRFPDVIEPLRDGRLCLSTTAELAKVLTGENLTEVLPRFFTLSAREAKELVAELMPREAPPVRPLVTQVEPTEAERRLVLGAVSGSPAARLDAQVGARTVPFRTSETPIPRPASRPAPRDETEPLTAELRRLHVTVTKQFLGKVDAARDGLSHAIPGATTEQVLEAALDLLLEKQARARGQVKHPRKPAPSATESQVQDAGVIGTVGMVVDEAGNVAAAESLAEPLHRRLGPRKRVPADVQRAVWERDQGRCVWPLDSGGVCGSTHQVEVDHSAVPWARGGQATLANLRLLCHAHNTLAARLAFGARCVERYSGTARRQRDQRSPSGPRRNGSPATGVELDQTSAPGTTV